MDCIQFGLDALQHVEKIEWIPALRKNLEEIEQLMMSLDLRHLMTA